MNERKVIKMEVALGVILLAAVGATTAPGIGCSADVNSPPTTSGGCPSPACGLRCGSGPDCVVGCETTGSCANCSTSGTSSSCGSSSSTGEPTTTTTPDPCASPVVCSKGDTKACTVTSSTGNACTSGAAVCSDDGTSFGPCVGEVPKSPAACSGPTTWNCDAPPACGSPDTAEALSAGDGLVVESMTSDPAGDVFLALQTKATITFASTPIPVGDFLLKLDTTGNVAWALPLTGVTFARVAATLDGDVFVTGQYKNTLQIGTVTISGAPNDKQGMIAKIGGDGTVAWGRPLGSSLFPFGLVTTSAGDVAVSGQRLGAATLDGMSLGASLPGPGFAAFLQGDTGAGTSLQAIGVTLPNQTAVTLALSTITLLDDEHAIVANARSASCGEDTLDLSLAQSHGGDAGATSIQTGVTLTPHAVATGVDGRVVVSGTPTALLADRAVGGELIVYDVIARKLVETIELPGPGTALAVAEDGSIYVGGSAANARDMFIGRYDGSTFNQYFQRTVPVTAPSMASSTLAAIVVLPSGVALAGGFVGTVDFGLEFLTRTVTSTGNPDAFFATLSP